MKEEISMRESPTSRMDLISYTTVDAKKRSLGP